MQTTSQNIARRPAASHNRDIGTDRDRKWPPWHWIIQVLPGLGLCLAVAAAALVAGSKWSQLSPFLLAIIAGVLVTNLFTLPALLSPGVTYASKKLLRLGIIFLGLKVALADIAALGMPTVMLVVLVVTVGITSTILLGRIFKVGSKLSTLIACGFSICGAAAVAGVEGVVDADDEGVVTAVALVVIFGTLMIPLLPIAGFMLHLPEPIHGIWVGASTHEVAQVVAAGDLIGNTALQTAVVTKLARVLLLAPVVIILGLRQRRAGGSDIQPGTSRPPLVPAFIIGFLAMVILRSTVTLPEALLQMGGVAQTVLLSAAMFALGLGVKADALKRVGPKPFLLAALSTIIVVTVAGLGSFTLL